MISVYSRKTEIELNARKLEILHNYNKLIQWGRKYPTRFVELIFKISLLDYQKYVFLNSWTAEKAVWVCSRNSGKSFLGSLFMMTKNLLFPKFETWILSLTAEQAKDTFTKIEKIAKKNIDSIVGSTDIFYNELVKSAANTDGFVHGQSGYKLELFNSSKIRSLVGNPSTIVGKRSNLNFYDEAGKLLKEFFALTEPFTTQDSDFKTGKGYSQSVHPRNVPTQCIYASSAEDVDSYLWDMYVDCSKQMLMGNRGFFVADINCDFPLNPTLDGKKHSPLLKQSEIDTAMRNNPTRAMREYYNIFDNTGGSESAVKRQDILKNESFYLPIDRAEGKDKEYVITYDPALQSHNSFTLIGEQFKHPEKGWMIRLVNGINYATMDSLGNKKPLRTEEQKKQFKNLIVNYGRGKDASYDNEHDGVKVYIDAGAGGGGRHYAEALIPGWEDSLGKKHNGIYDENDIDCKDLARSYPNAENRCGLIEPTKYRTLMFSALVSMVEQGLILFPPPVPRNGELEIGEKVYNLTTEELRALVEIDLTKEEILAIHKVKTPSGNIVYKLPPNKINKVSDDRAYCLAMIGWHLSELRKQDMFASEEKRQDISSLAKRMVFKNSDKKLLNPFANQRNPFSSK